MVHYGIFFAMVLIISLAYGLARLFHALNLMPKKFGKDFKEKKARSVALSTMFFVVFLLPVRWWREGGIGGMQSWTVAWLRSIGAAALWDWQRARWVAAASVARTP